MIFSYYLELEGKQLSEVFFYFPAIFQYEKIYLVRLIFKQGENETKSDFGLMKQEKD